MPSLNLVFVETWEGLELMWCWKRRKSPGGQGVKGGVHRPLTDKSLESKNTRRGESGEVGRGINVTPEMTNKDRFRLHVKKRNSKKILKEQGPKALIPCRFIEGSLGMWS